VVAHAEGVPNPEEAMKDHVRRHVGHSAEAVWWLVPIAFAIAALAAVAMIEGESTEAPARHAQAAAVVNMPNAAPGTAAAGPVVVTPAVAQPEEPVFEERVPTF
jgi:hypothetical protein